MKNSVKKKWIKALKSGKYVLHPNGELKIDNHFSALGLLCHLLRHKAKLIWYVERPYGKSISFALIYKMGQEGYKLPKKIAKLAGLPQVPTVRTRMVWSEGKKVDVPITMLDVYTQRKELIRLIKKQL